MSAREGLSEARDVAVVICAHDERRFDLIRSAVSSVMTQIPLPREVVVVVDGNPRLLERIGSEIGVRAIANDGPKGIHGARNSGLACTEASIVVYLDDDAAATEGWLRRICEPYADPDVAAVGGGADPAWETARPSWFPREFDWVIGCSYLGMPTETAEVRNPFGCNMSYRREVLEELGGFRLGYGCDETELCIRLRQRWPDRKVIYVPEAKISHHVPEDRSGLRRFLRRCYFEGGSKAVVSRLVGRGEGLATERVYTRSVLPRGVTRGLWDVARHRDLTGLGRAGAIVLGLLSTALGYATGLLFVARAARRRGWQGSLPR